jgi:hypothetical protein
VPEKRGQGAGLPKDPDVKTVGNDPEKRWRGGKGAAHRIEERVNACYSYILEGGTRRQITERLSSRFGTSLRTSDDDYTKAMKLLKEEQIATRDDLLNQIQALRLAGARKALAKGQLQTFSMLLKDMGAVIGEVENLESTESINLNIKIEE